MLTAMLIKVCFIRIVSANLSCTNFPGTINEVYIGGIDLNNEITRTKNKSVDFCSETHTNCFATAVYLYIGINIQSGATEF